MMNRHILYFVNPVSGTRGKEALMKMILEKTAAAGIRCQLAHTNAAGDYAFLPGKITREGITDVVVCGGDGTVNQVGAVLLHSHVNVGIIPLGSGNGLAFSARIPKDPHNALQVILKGRAAAIDGFLINNKFSCMLCGLGFDAQVAHDFARQRKRGLATYVKQSLRNFLRARPYPFTLYTPGGGTISTSAWFISIANSNQFGNHVTIAPAASLSDGLLDIVVVKKMNRLMLVFRLLWQIRMGRLRAEDHPDFGRQRILYFQAARIRVDNPGLAPLHIDGEPAETEPQFSIEVLPAALRLLH